MLLSAREMGLGDDHTGIVELPDDAPVGVPYVHMGRAGRSGDRRQRHAQPRRLLLACAASRATWPPAGIGTLKPSQPARVPAAFHGGPHWQIDWPEACPWVLGRTIRSVQKRPQPEMAAGPADLDRAAADQRAGRRDQLLHHRSRPAAARVRRGEADRRRADLAARRAARTFRALNGKDYTVDRRRTARSPTPPACSRWPA